MEETPRDGRGSGEAGTNHTVVRMEDFRSKPETPIRLERALPTPFELQKLQAESLAVIAESFSLIAQSLSSLPRVIDQAVNTLVKGQGVNSILGGLAQHDGRQALDARTMKQNALEIVEQMELVFKKYNERMRESYRSATLVDAEEDFKENECRFATQPSSQEVSSQEQPLQHPSKPS